MVADFAKKPRRFGAALQPLRFCKLFSSQGSAVRRKSCAADLMAR